MRYLQCTYDSRKKGVKIMFFVFFFIRYSDRWERESNFEFWGKLGGVCWGGRKSVRANPHFMFVGGVGVNNTNPWSAKK